MKFRLRCSQCRASFEVEGDSPSTVAICPECGKAHRLPPHVEPSPPIEQGRSLTTGQESGSDAIPAGGVSVFIPSAHQNMEPKKSRGWGAFAVIGLCFLLLGSGLTAWPWLKQTFWKSEPKDPVERVARSYLDALVREDADEAQRLGTVEEPPAISSFQEATHLKGKDQTLKGSFAPLAKLHKKINADFDFDPKIGRFTPKNPLGPAAVVLDALHDAKESQDKSGVVERLVGGNEQENLDAAVEYGESQLKMIGKLAEGVLAPKRLIPTYAMLVKEAKPPLPATENELALDFGENPETWGALLKRQYVTLKADGPYQLDHAQVLATVRDRLGSLGDPPTTLRLKLVRFRLEGIDTGWKVISAQRVLPNVPEENAPADKPARADEKSFSDGLIQLPKSLGDAGSKD